MSTKNAILLAEFIGTMLLTAAVLYGANPFVVLGILVLIIGPLTGSHVNPAVSAGLAVVNKFKPATMLWYWVVQILGAVAAKIVYELFSPAQSDFSLAFTSFTGSDMMVEILGAAVFLFGITMAVGQKLKGVPLAIAVGGALYAGALFGGVLNPAVAIGIDKITVATLVGPMIGAGLGAWLGTAISAHVKPAKD